MWSFKSHGSAAEKKSWKVNFNLLSIHSEKVLDKQSIIDSQIFSISRQTNGQKNTTAIRELRTTRNWSFTIFLKWMPKGKVMILTTLHKIFLWTRQPTMFYNDLVESSCQCIIPCKEVAPKPQSLSSLTLPWLAQHRGEALAIVY